jgi:glycosyltransferase involved in cell wall biosynthesis
LSKSRNVAIKNGTEDIILIADDDVTYDDKYENTILSEWNKHRNADIICFYVKSKNPNRKTKRMKSGKVGYVRSMRILSFEISFKKKAIEEKGLNFNENFGIGTENNRGEEQIFLWDALKNGMEILFVNKKIGTAEQKESMWFNGYDLHFFQTQGRIFKKMSPRYYKFLIFQYAFRKYFLYYKNLSIKQAIKCMLDTY